MSDDLVAECPDLACTRRRVLAAAGGVAGLGALDLAAPSMAFAAQSGRRGDLLVVVQLEGGADGLTLVPPLGDRDYLAARPGVGVTASQAVRLDGTFGLHRGLSPLLPYWRSQQLAMVHAVGDSDGTRSHFEATDAMDRGVSQGSSVRTGWIDRHLVSRGLRPSDFPALAIRDKQAGPLVGRAPDLSTYSVKDLRIQVPAPLERATESAISGMYAGLSGPVADSARVTLRALAQCAPLRGQTYTPHPGVAYPEDHLGRSLRQVAQVARAGLGLEVACVTGYGWDTHEGMGSGPGSYMHDQVSRLGQALAAFAKDLGPLLATTTIVTVSEFGRRVAQNGSNGLDHGHGSAMLLLGGGIRGGRVYAHWPGLSKQRLDNGDLRVTTDYRDVLGELVRRRLGNSDLRAVFPDYRPLELGLARRS